MHDILINGARNMGIEMTRQQADMFCRYHEMLTEVNKSMNLTRVSDDPLEAVDRSAEEKGE